MKELGVHDPAKRARLPFAGFHPDETSLETSRVSSRVPAGEENRHNQGPFQFPENRREGRLSMIQLRPRPTSFPFFIIEEWNS